MIRFLPLRLAASAIALSTVLHGAPVTAQIAPAAAATMTMAHISVVEMGRGSPVVLIPGLSTPRAVWDGIAPDLARNHRVILVQVNGFGGEAPGDNLKPGLLDGVVSDLNAYLTAHKLRQVDVIGHSMGGLVALMMAKAHPDAVRRLMIVDSLPYIGELFAPGATVAQVEPQARMMRDGMAAAYGRPADPATTQTMAARMASKPEGRARVVDWMSHADVRVSAAAMYEDMTTDLRPAIAGLTMPITVVYPGADAPNDRGTALYHRAYAGAPHVTYVPVADSAHFVMLDQPSAFAAAVANFLK